MFCLRLQYQLIDIDAAALEHLKEVNNHFVNVTAKRLNPSGNSLEQLSEDWQCPIQSFHCHYL